MNSDSTESVRIKTDIMARFREIARLEKRTISGQLEVALEKWLEEYAS